MLFFDDIQFLFKKLDKNKWKEDEQPLSWDGKTLCKKQSQNYNFIIRAVKMRKVVDFFEPKKIFLMRYWECGNVSGLPSCLRRQASGIHSKKIKIATSRPRTSQRIAPRNDVDQFCKAFWGSSLRSPLHGFVREHGLWQSHKQKRLPPAREWRVIV